MAPQALILFAYFACGLNSVADVTFAVLPMCIVWGTSMNIRTRLTVCFLLGIGSVACIATLVRVGYVDTLSSIKGDFLYDSANLALLSTIEVGLGIIAASAATFRPLFRRWLDRSDAPTKQAMPQLNTYTGEGSGQSAMRLTKSNAEDTIITGRESIGSMPSLVYAVEEKDEVDILAVEMPSQSEAYLEKV